MVGLSLSFCVKDIARGMVREEDVEKIICGTCAETRREFLVVLRQYMHTYWRTFPNEAFAIAKRLYDAGKIEQPRIHGGEPHNIASGHWLVRESELKQAE